MNNIYRTLIVYVDNRCMTAYNDNYFGNIRIALVNTNQHSPTIHYIVYSLTVIHLNMYVVLICLFMY